MKKFYPVLLNTVVANVTTGYLWFALTFWAYLNTQSVLATGVIGGAYMILVALTGMLFGTYVDRHKKKRAMSVSATITTLAFVIATALYFSAGGDSIAGLSNPIFWVLIGVVLLGAVIENMRNVALSTTVTIMIPKQRRDKANGLVGAAQGIGFIATSALSGLSVGLLGLGWTLIIATTITILTFIHLIFFVHIKEKQIAHDPELANKQVDLKGAIKAIHLVPGLMALIIFSTFNNLIGGVYMTLMDPYGLTLFSVETWGLFFAVAGTGFVFGGLLIAKTGLGKNPVKTLLVALLVMAALGALFTIREWWWLYALGMWLYMCIVPFVEAAEQTVVQRVVPLKQQGRVFGFAQSVEAAAAPLTAFAIAPLAEFFIIPYAKSEQGAQQLAPLLGHGEVRGIALVFLGAGVIMAIMALLAFKTKSYKLLSQSYEKA
jgi:DHA3 family multidrug efflux protein-like MFS transporter